MSENACDNNNSEQITEMYQLISARWHSYTISIMFSFLFSSIVPQNNEVFTFDEFSDFSKFKESDKSLKHELDSRC